MPAPRSYRGVIPEGAEYEELREQDERIRAQDERIRAQSAMRRRRQPNYALEAAERAIQTKELEASELPDPWSQPDMVGVPKSWKNRIINTDWYHPYKPSADPSSSSIVDRLLSLLTPSEAGGGMPKVGNPYQQVPNKPNVDDFEIVKMMQTTPRHRSRMAMYIRDLAHKDPEEAKAVVRGLVMTGRTPGSEGMMLFPWLSDIPGLSDTENQLRRADIMETALNELQLGMVRDPEEPEVYDPTTGRMRPSYVPKDEFMIEAAPSRPLFGPPPRSLYELAGQFGVYQFTPPGVHLGNLLREAAYDSMNNVKEMEAARKADRIRRWTPDTAQDWEGDITNSFWGTVPTSDTGEPSKVRAAIQKITEAPSPRAETYTEEEGP